MTFAYPLKCLQFTAVLQHIPSPVIVPEFILSHNTFMTGLSSSQNLPETNVQRPRSFSSLLPWLCWTMRQVQKGKKQSPLSTPLINTESWVLGRGCQNSAIFLCKPYTTLISEYYCSGTYNLPITRIFGCLYCCCVFVSFYSEMKTMEKVSVKMI